MPHARCRAAVAPGKLPMPKNLTPKNLILVDVGNTTTKIGLVYKGVREVYSLETNSARTSDSLGFSLLSILAHARCEPGDFEACVICSVVPAMDPLFRAAIARFVGCPLLFTPADLPVPLENRYHRPEQVGADRLVAAWAARVLWPEHRGLVVVDFGTAVTFDCVQDMAYLGGLIFPGPMTALNALAGAAANLSAVNLECSDPVPTPGRDTATSIRHGILFGFASLVDGLVAKLAAQLDGPVKVVGTGGFAGDISRISAQLHDVTSSLLLEGLEILYEHNMASKGAGVGKTSFPER